MKKLLALILLCLPTTLGAQTVIADRFTFNTGPCVLRSGSGTPEGSVTGNVCDTYWRTDTGIIYNKTSGTGNTGWTTSSLTGSGTTDTITKWTGASALGNSTITDAAGGNTTFASAGDLIVNPTGNDVLPTTGYDINLGSLTTKFLSLHAAELWVETLVAQSTMATIGGRVLVAPTTLLTSDLASGATSMVVKHNNLANGDRVYLEANGQVEFIAIGSSASGAGPYTYSSLTRNLDGSGANNWAAGDAVLDTGTTGNGFIDLYSVRGVSSASEIGPTVVGNVRTGTTYNAWSPRWAIGNLNGLYGYSGSNYGAVFGVPSGARVTVDATNGIRIYGGDNDEKVTIDTSGNATFDGKLTIGNQRNMLRNSECRVGTDDWSLVNPDALTAALSFNFSTTWTLLSESSTCYIEVTGTPANTKAIYSTYTPKFPVVPTNRYEASVYFGLHRTPLARVYISWYKIDDTLITNSLGSSCTDASTGGKELSGYCRSSIIATAPALAAYAQITMQSVYDGTDANPFMFWVRAFFGEAGSAQTGVSEWSPAGQTEIIGGMIKTGAIETRTLAADSVTSAKIVAGTIVASDIAAATITGTQIAATTITASNLNVSTLSAISANMGTITAGSITGGTIDGATINAGSGDEVVLNSSGITIASGSGASVNAVKWTDSSNITSVSGIMVLAASDINLIATGAITLSPLAGLGANRFVCHDNSGHLYSSATTCDGSAPAPSAVAVAAMQRELAELREQMRVLLTPAATPATARPLQGEQR